MSETTTVQTFTTEGGAVVEIAQRVDRVLGITDYSFSVDDGRVWGAGFESASEAEGEARKCADRGS